MAPNIIAKWVANFYNYFWLSEERVMRYKVPMTFRWRDFEKEVVVTLKNRGHMNYPVLLGRNFLEGFL